MKKQQTPLANNQSGIVSVMLTVFIMIMVTLIVIGFSEITRREHRQSLDRQLSTQAFYAAESGVNLTVNKVRADSTFPKEATTCTPMDISSGGDNLATSVPCVLYDAQPTDLEYTSITKQNGKIIPLNTAGGFAPGVKLEWNASELYKGQFGSCPGATPTLETISASGCDAGYMRATVLTTTGGIGREALYNNSFTVFFKPSSGGGSVAYKAHDTNDKGAADQGKIIPVTCSGSPEARCKATITNLPANSYLHIRSLFKDNAVKITSTDGARFTQAQIKVDSTGKVSDVLRRIQVRISYFDDYELPSYVIDGAGEVCKRLSLHPPVEARPGSGLDTNQSPYGGPGAIEALSSQGGC
ncbi:MAG: pilus assembly PilX N-terminal domain-containing protein [Candidatus Saccharimonadales bacterium]